VARIPESDKTVRGEQIQALLGLCDEAEHGTSSAQFRSRLGTFLMTEDHPEAAGVLFATTAVDAVRMQDVHFARLRRLFPSLVVDGKLTGVGIGARSFGLELRDHQEVTSLEGLQGMPLTLLTLDRTKVSDLGPLRGMPLQELWLAWTKVDDLGPLAGMPLTRLYLTSTRVSDISPLRGMPLTNLGLESCSGVRDITALKGMPLTSLDLGMTGVSDLSALAGMRLTVLNLISTRVSDLIPLRGMPLVQLSLDSCLAVTDLTPLAGMPLESLRLHFTMVSDLSPLAGMPLATLYLAFTKVTDLGPLRGAPLVDLFFPWGATNIDFLRSVPTLTQINEAPAAEFWRAYDMARQQVSDTSSPEFHKAYLAALRTGK
jgi:Leucine-rich repeat (LRR) protein